MVGKTNLGGRNLATRKRRRTGTHSSGADESIASQRTAIRLATLDESISFNTLSPVGKQAALSLMDQKTVTIEKRGDELVVEKRKPRFWLPALTIGLVSR